MAVPDPGAVFVFPSVDAVCSAPGASVTVATAVASAADVAAAPFCSPSGCPGKAAVFVAGSIVVCVKRLKRLVLPPPTPTAGTAPSSVPFFVGAAD